VASGWEPTLAGYKGAKEFAQAKQRQQPCTVGDFLGEVVRTASNQRSYSASQNGIKESRVTSQSTTGSSSVSDRSSDLEGEPIEREQSEIEYQEVGSYQQL
jgi:hypothetical protein